jgi:hypothetical protein
VKSPVPELEHVTVDTIRPPELARERSCSNERSNDHSDDFLSHDRRCSRHCRAPSDKEELCLCPIPDDKHQVFWSEDKGSTSGKPYHMSTGRIVRLWFNADFDLFARDARLELANDRGIERDRLNAMTMTDVFPTRGTIVIVAGGVLIGNGVGELGYRIRPTSFLADTYAAIRA